MANPKQPRVESLPAATDSHQADILVAGSVALDLNCDYAGEAWKGPTRNTSPDLHTSNPAYISQCVGGVGHNVALAAHKVSRDTTVRLCSMVGDDV
jgi:pseudouridylate synthase / pseudouridine kinase